MFVRMVVDPGFVARPARLIAGAAREAAAQDPVISAHLRAKADSDRGFQELDRLLDQSFSSQSAP